MENIIIIMIEPFIFMRRENIVNMGYDAIAKKYHVARHHYDNKKEFDQFVSFLPEHARVLDAGCSAGVPIAKFLVTIGCDLVGIDFSGSILKLARENVLQSEFIMEDMTQMGFTLNSFDGLIASYSVIHIPREHHLSVFQSFNRILKPHGILLVSMGSLAWEGTERFYGVEMFWSHYSAKTSYQIIQKSGFQIIADAFIEHQGEKHYWILARNVKESV